MRTVFSSHADVCHAFAQNDQDYGRGSNVYFDDGVLYSYGRHFAMAAFDKKDSNLVYFTTRGYSPSTSKHLSIARSALSHYDKIYCYDPEKARDGNHRDNLDNFEARAKWVAQSLPRSRKPEIYLNEIASIRSEFEAYIEHFKIAKKHYKNFVYLFIQSKDGGTEATEKERKAQARERKRQEKLLKKQHEEQVAMFRNFEREMVTTNLGLSFLRYNAETERIETSQRVHIPLETARRFYSWIKKTVAEGGCTDCEEKILQYKVTSVDDKFLQVGCHKIRYSEVLELGKQLFE